MMRAMEHSRKAATEGWRLLATVCVVAPVLFYGSLFADMETTMRIMWAIFLVIASSLAVAYAINNIRTSESFTCRLTDTTLTQSIPASGSGDSFSILLSEITLIEIRSTLEEDRWHIHTESDRYELTYGYGNPCRKFGKAIQEAVPHVQTINT